MGLTLLLNVFFYLRLDSGQETTDGNLPFVSLLIPARNEAATIGRTLTQLTKQTYPSFEIIVLDDNSSDGTAAIARESAAHFGRFQLIQGGPLPTGWLGKNHACHQLARAATGDIVVFTDADVAWQPQALAALVAQMSVTNADMLTVWPTQTTETAGERLTVPLIALAILAYLPIAGVHYLPLPIFAAANGQCIAFRRPAYNAIGGHTTVRDRIVEDVALAQATKSADLRLRMCDGNRLIGCRMYRNWSEARDGFSKNILAGHGNSQAALLLSTVFHWVVFVAPVVWLTVALTQNGGLLWPIVAHGRWHRHPRGISADDTSTHLGRIADAALGCPDDTDCTAVAAVAAARYDNVEGAGYWLTGRLDDDRAFLQVKLVLDFHARTVLPCNHFGRKATSATHTRHRQHKIIIPIEIGIA